MVVAVLLLIRTYQQLYAVISSGLFFSSFSSFFFVSFLKKVKKSHFSNFHVLLVGQFSASQQDVQNEDLGFADRLLASGSSRKRTKTSAYRATQHVHPTTNVVERLFSRCKLNMTALRKKMDPDSLDMLMFLKANRELWPDARTMQHLLDSLTAEERANADLDDGNDEEEEVFEGY